MSNFLYKEIESKLFEIDAHLSQESYLDDEEINFLSKKRLIDEEGEGETKDNFFITESINDVFQRKKPNEFLDEEIKDDIIYKDLYLIKTRAKEPFKVIYPEIHLFSKAEINLEESFQKKFDFSVRKRTKKKLPKFLRRHNIREVIKKRFFNTYIMKALNKKLKATGYNTYFEKLPQSFFRNVSKGLNKEIMKKTLGQILKEKETYAKEDTKIFKHNSNLVDKIEKDGNSELNLILNTKICHLFDEYLNSAEFLIIERNRIAKKKNMTDDYYLQKYIYLSKNWNKFCSSKKK